MTQKTYVDNILKVFGIENYTPATTLIDEKLKFNTNIEEEEVDVILHWNIIKKCLHLI